MDQTCVFLNAGSVTRIQTALTGLMKMAVVRDGSSDFSILDVQLILRQRSGTCS